MKFEYGKLICPARLALCSAVCAFILAAASCGKDGGGGDDGDTVDADAACPAAGDFKIEGDAAVECIAQPDGTFLWEADATKHRKCPSGYSIRQQSGRSSGGLPFLWCDDGAQGVSFSFSTPDGLPAPVTSASPCTVADEGKYVKVVALTAGGLSAGKCVAGSIVETQTGSGTGCVEGFTPEISANKSSAWCKDSLGRIALSVGTEVACSAEDAGKYFSTGVTSAGISCLLECGSEGKARFGMVCPADFKATANKSGTTANCLADDIMTLKEGSDSCGDTVTTTKVNFLCEAALSGKFRLAYDFEADDELVAAKCVPRDGKFEWWTDEAKGAVRCAAETTPSISSDGKTVTCI